MAPRGRKELFFCCRDSECVRRVRIRSIPRASKGWPRDSGGYWSALFSFRLGSDIHESLIVSLGTAERVLLGG